ncbi:hypothetical protein BBH99_18140 [Chryseobacterium contaminans]|uniref:Uncharacterized protein n=2 Tax=Chryseobacterium contaminans TaxID=1423959 RepID=A0A1M7HAV0_9FLAO|nr:hypothetical protein BBH99_18140 [Chryseobacterium contaminans]SHM25565.1 hypothetical protein SAMN05444407_111153 [Chryseobacterium contaminans]
MKKEFYLKNVIAFNPKYAYSLAIPCILFWTAIYYFFIGTNFKLSFMMIFGLLCFITIYFVMKLLSVNVTLGIDKDYLYIKKNNKEEKYTKSDVVGFHTYNYDSVATQKKSALRLEIKLVNDKKIFLDSIEGIDMDILITLIKTLQHELNFEIVERNKFNNKYWYSIK